MCQGVKEMRFRGDTLLTGVLLLEMGAKSCAAGGSVWSRTCEICLSRDLPSSRACKVTATPVSAASRLPHEVL